MIKNWKYNKLKKLREENEKKKEKIIKNERINNEKKK